MRNEYTNQTKQYTVEELAHTAAKRVDIVKIQMVKDKSLLYKYRAISCPNDGYQLMRQFLGDVDREYLIVLCLNTKNEPTNINCCHIGSINSSIAHPREIFKTAILSNSAHIMVGHTHPSGNIITRMVVCQYDSGTVSDNGGFENLSRCRNRCIE